MKKCSIEDCDNKYRCKGFCDKHYRRFLAHGDATQVRIPAKACKVEGCDNKPRKLGYCIKHHARFKRYNDESIVIAMDNRHVFKSANEKFDNSFEMITESGCWIWKEALTNSGYGTLNFNRKAQLAHRYSYERFIGIIPENLNVCHRCDAPCCVNPNHLFLGSAQDNINDKIIKGRQPRGSALKSSKLIEWQVSEIKVSNEKYTMLAAKFGVTPETISYIKRGKTWRHVE